MRNRTLLSIASFFTAFSIYHFISIPFDELPPLPGYFLSVIAQLCVAVFIYLFATKLTKLLAVITLSFFSFLYFHLYRMAVIFIGIYQTVGTALNLYSSMIKNLRTTQASDPIVATKTKPNIFIFLFDGYQRSDILKKFYGYDNSEFLQELGNKGFKTFNNSQSNFPKLRKV